MPPVTLRPPAAPAVARPHPSASRAWTAATPPALNISLGGGRSSGPSQWQGILGGLAAGLAPLITGDDEKSQALRQMLTAGGIGLSGGGLLGGLAGLAPTLAQILGLLGPKKDGPVVPPPPGLSAPFGTILPGTMTPARPGFAPPPSTPSAPPATPRASATPTPRASATPAALPIPTVESLLAQPVASPSAAGSLRLPKGTADASASVSSDLRSRSLRGPVTPPQSTPSVALDRVLRTPPAEGPDARDGWRDAFAAGVRPTDNAPPPLNPATLDMETLRMLRLTVSDLAQPAARARYEAALAAKQR
jgi:hypothetical protein